MSQEITQNEIVQQYGNVLFELAQEKSLLERILTDTHHLLSCIHQDQQAWSFIASPVISLDLQARILKKIGESLECTELTSRFLRIVGHNRRLLHLEAMLEEFIGHCKSVAGVVEGTLETATALPPQVIQKLQKTLGKVFGKDVILESSVKKNLLGGIILRIGSFRVDASVETRLNKLAEMMKE